MSTISASTTSTTAYKVTADTTGTLVLQTGSGPTTAVTVDTSQNVGIGTSSPTLNTNGTVLHLNNSTASRAAVIHMTNAESGSTATDGLICGKWSDGTNYFFDYDSNPIVFGTGGTNRAIIDTNGNFQFNSGYGSAATAYGCRAWVNFNGTGTVAIRASGNVSSITDNGTGDYTVNFTNAMPDSNYCAVGCAGRANDGNNYVGFDTNTYSTTQVKFFTKAAGSAPNNTDMTGVYIAIFR